MSDEVVPEVLIRTAAEIVTSVITTGLVKRMNLKEGDKVFAVMKATSVSVEKGQSSGLVPDVLRCSGVNGVFGDVGRMITDSFERTPDENEVEISAQLSRVLGHSINQFTAGNPI